MKPTYEELEAKCQLQQNKLDAINKLMGVIESASDLAKDGIESLEQQLSESRREFTEANATIHNLELKVAQVVAENSRCKFEVSRCHQTVDEMFKNREKWVDKEWLSSIWSTSKRLMNETPATDAAIANIQAQGVEMLATAYDERAKESTHYMIINHCKVKAEQAREFAAQLRQGAKS